MCISISRPNLFTTTSSEHLETTQNCTSGIDAYVTKNRVILLDCQPILSSSVAYSISQKRLNPSIDSSSLLADNEMVSLQLTAFLLSVCHIVLLVQDWVFDPNIFKYEDKINENNLINLIIINNCLLIIYA